MVLVEILEIVGVTGPLAGGIELVASLGIIYVLVDTLKNGASKFLGGK